MYKSKSASMKRGAMMRAHLSPRIKSAEQVKLPERPLNAKMTDDERIEFNSAAKPLGVLLDELRPVVTPLNGQKPLRIATRLNVGGWTTAQGRRWDARLVYLLLAYLSGKPVAHVTKRRRTPKTQQNNATKGPPQGVTSPEPPKMLTREELTDRLGKLGRVKS